MVMSRHRQVYLHKKKKRERDPKKILQHQKNNHPMLAPCKCKNKCIEKISEEERNSLWSAFWSMA